MGGSVYLRNKEIEVLLNALDMYSENMSNGSGETLEILESEEKDLSRVDSKLRSLKYETIRKEHFRETFKELNEKIKI